MPDRERQINNTGTDINALLDKGLKWPTNAARSGFLPVLLEHASSEALTNIDVYLTGKIEGTGYTLYCAAHTRFSDAHRRRLREAGVRFVYIPLACQRRYHQQMEQALTAIVGDPDLTVSAKAELVYQATIDLARELLADTEHGPPTNRLRAVAQAVTTVVLNEPTHFPYLFSAAQHDYYTATHLVNVATWMVPLAHVLGYRDDKTLELICLAGMLHDIGKIYVSQTILDKTESLTDDDWAVVRRHPELGSAYLARHDTLPELVHMVITEHHERLDGSGYPLGLKADQIHPVSRMCAVVEAFDAMTACRPYRETAWSASAALDYLRANSPGQFDQAIVEAWEGMLRGVDQAGVLAEPLLPAATAVGRRAARRYRINCRARICRYGLADGPWQDQAGLHAVAHSISRNGLGLLCDQALEVGESIRVRLEGGGTLDRTVDGHVVRCRSQTTGDFDVGVALQVELGQAADPDV